MAILTSQSIAALNVGLLTRQLVLPMTVARITGGEFAGDNGDTITVRVPQPGTARTQATPGATITYDDVTEVGVDVTLSHLYHAKRVTDEELSLEIVDFGAQVSAVQVGAVAEGAEDQLASAMNAIAADASFDLTASTDDTEDKIYAAAEALSTANVPAGDRFLAVSPGIATRILKVLGGRQTSDTDSAVRASTIGQFAGFSVVESNGLTAGTAVAYHRTGFAFANRTPVRPRGASDSSTATVGGVGLRHIFQYQPDILSDASVVSTFAGAAVVDTDRVYKLDTSAT